MIQFKWYLFSELSLEFLYALLALRSKVFVVEQNCVFLDPDGKDLNARHLLGVENNTLVAYMRLLPPTESQNYVVFGRIVTAGEVRKNGYGKKLMQELLNYCDLHYPGYTIKCSAQFRLQDFYASFGFKPIGEPYDEDEMPHIAMELLST